jgi:hypothetical protein
MAEWGEVSHARHEADDALERVRSLAVLAARDGEPGDLEALTCTVAVVLELRALALSIDYGLTEAARRG